MGVGFRGLGFTGGPSVPYSSLQVPPHHIIYFVGEQIETDMEHEMGALSVDLKPQP